MKLSNSAEIRQAFLDFFQEMGHEIVSSSPLPVKDNPTLLFTNAGMNQFVDTFLGKEEIQWLQELLMKILANGHQSKGVVGL